MGEVYRAADVNLGRHVAIKVLPPSWVEGPTLADLIAKGAASDSSRWYRLPRAAMQGSRVLTNWQTTLNVR
jgi:hypothetical protein